MNYNEFFTEAAKLNIRLPLQPTAKEYHSSLDNEALFQLPILAMVILTISKGNSKPIFSEIGQLVGECLERTVSGFKGSSQDIGWSANLRIRTVKALTLLERLDFIVVDSSDGRVSTEAKGRRVIESVLAGDSPLSHAMLVIERSYENIRAEQRIRTEV
ncbi:hypothetical protein BVZ28_18405 [Alcaligenes faecalis]|uniref:hypothetical protein n=1 Tax=Alcaligenes faecalis TaxID=511 RepID=UPI000A2D1B77|nr:hypothetical protein [Alcaligenes faecalis]KAA1287204.1 hypothetical protein D7S43_06045 [Alcaligenes faecalis]OSZ30695.1 hypothetical protein BVZ28_18405 [Alcaligenes faecalis]OSZ35658.1 hypothetical protein BVZ29_20255 [Alcaligenes faecalis]